MILISMSQDGIHREHLSIFDTEILRSKMKNKTNHPMLSESYPPATANKARHCLK